MGVALLKGRTNGKVLSRMRGKPTLLLTTTGRRTGRLHTVPLPYLADGDAMIVVGSASGAERHPAWVLNLIASPRVTVQYAGYQQRTSREIPLIRLTRAQSANTPT